MIAAQGLDETHRAIVREVVGEEVRGALAAQKDGGHRNASESYLSIAKAAQLADVAPGTIRAWIRAGRLASRRAGRVYRIARAELETFMERSSVERGDVDVRGLARSFAGHASASTRRSRGRCCASRSRPSRSKTP